MFEVALYNTGAEEFFYSTARNTCFSGGYGNGKTTVGCQKIIFLCLSFPGYRAVIARQRYGALISTTMETFFLQLEGGPDSPYIEYHSKQEKITKFKNGSEVLWRHLDEFNESTYRGLEINSVLIDQAEEVGEREYLTLDARIGRWTGAKVPDYLDPESFEKDSKGQPRPPSYMMLLANPSYIGHWIWLRFNPESPEHAKYKDSHNYIERGTDPRSYDEATYRQLLSREPEWVERFVHGKWGIGAGTIHVVTTSSILTVPEEFVEELLRKATLYRAMDHGEASATCCLWFAVHGGQIFCYREYYMPEQVISYHRKEIVTLSGNEEYAASYADPAIFKKNSQKDGGFWSVALEYADATLRHKGQPVDPISWTAADNNEMATRNRINEYLMRNPSLRHPVTGELGAPVIYFINKIEGTDFGCEQVITQTRAQKRVLEGTMNGKDWYSDERDDDVPDHAYDPLRYMIAMHGGQAQVKERIHPGTMAHARQQARMLRRAGYLQ
jgi:hypothetical protein